jgi:hypothetical protein
VEWATTITAAGAFLGGLALPIAFLQLGAQRQDRLRAQVGKIGAWAGPPSRSPGESGPVEWAVQVFIRNSSELPVVVDAADLSVRPWGFELALAGEDAAALYAVKKLGDSRVVPFAPGTIAPGETWSVFQGYQPEAVYDQPQPPMVAISRVVVTDAAGRQWEIRPYKARPPRRVRWWLRRRWRRRGDL